LEALWVVVLYLEKLGDAKILSVETFLSAPFTASIKNFFVLMFAPINTTNIVIKKPKREVGKPKKDY